MPSQTLWTLPAISNSTPVLPKDLDNIFEEYTEDDYKLFVTRADYAADKFNLDFVLEVQDINDEGAVIQKWTIEAIGHRKNQVSFGYCEFLKILEDDPLLWEFTDVQSELYFNGQVEDAVRLFFDLYVMHKKLFEGYQSFDIHFGENTPYFKQFQYSNGLLTKGSKRLMEHYANCLEQNGLSYSIVGDWRPTYWDGEKHISEPQDLKVLLLGDTYIIAESFSFVRQDENSR